MSPCAAKARAVAVPIPPVAPMISVCMESVNRRGEPGTVGRGTERPAPAPSLLLYELLHETRVFKVEASHPAPDRTPSHMALAARGRRLAPVAQMKDVHSLMGAKSAGADNVNARGKDAAPR
ncbi:hypothetical protein GCM10017781_17800 [Deinococcus metalli]|uniref:Uncharacterized protein n=1 Tax=Deinococcus metalli TaxID=1141878 RepID=A0ABQ3JSL7_9DEIO|nr:hypothetical protein GCM10017781_17800 [Deinococcus metalli]